MAQPFDRHRGERAVPRALIEVVEETASTNADLVRRLGAGEPIPEGYWLQAIRQNAGRGRRGREWVSREGNLTCSTVVNLHAGDPAVHTLAFVAALAVHDVVAEELARRQANPSGQGSDQSRQAASEERVVLKWPNDVLINGAKVCGILLERVGDHVVAGIGINIAYAPEVAGRVTTSLRAAGSGMEARAALEGLAARFSIRLTQWRFEGLPAILGEWQRRASAIGRPLLVMLDEEGMLAGAFAGLDPDGALRLRLADGTLRVIYAGDVSLV